MADADFYDVPRAGLVNVTYNEERRDRYMRVAVRTCHAACDLMVKRRLTFVCHRCPRARSPCSVPCLSLCQQASRLARPPFLPVPSGAWSLMGPHATLGTRILRLTTAPRRSTRHGTRSTRCLGTGPRTRKALHTSGTHAFLLQWRGQRRPRLTVTVGCLRASIVDKDRNLVSWTTTVEENLGSGVVVPGRGFVLNNELTGVAARHVASVHAAVLTGAAGCLHACHSRL